MTCRAMGAAFETSGSDLGAFGCAAGLVSFEQGQHPQVRTGRFACFPAAEVNAA